MKAITHLRVVVEFPVSRHRGTPREYKSHVFPDEYEALNEIIPLFQAAVVRVPASGQPVDSRASGN